MLGPRALTELAKRHFRQVRLYGQSIRGNLIHSVLKSLDVLNLRHRLLPSRALQGRIALEAMGQQSVPTPGSFRFSRRLVRQSPHIIVLAVAPKRSREKAVVVVGGSADCSSGAPLGGRAILPSLYGQRSRSREERVEVAHLAGGRIGVSRLDRGQL
jgi:hypothetical protein